MGNSSAFEKTKLNSVGRHKERGRYDYKTVFEITRACPVLHVAWVDPTGLPQCMPMVGAIEETDDEEVYLYLHGSAASRFVKNNDDESLPMVVTATLLDGLVMALTPFNHSMHYRCAILHGTTMPFSSTFDADPEAAKMHALHLITNVVVPDRWESTRIPPTSTEMDSTGVIRLKVQSASAKINYGEKPNDQQQDMTNEEVASKTWSGIIPVQQVLLPPKTAPHSRIKDDNLPQHIKDLPRIFNERMKTAGRS